MVHYFDWFKFLFLERRDSKIRYRIASTWVQYSCCRYPFWKLLSFIATRGSKPLFVTFDSNLYLGSSTRYVTWATKSRPAIDATRWSSTRHLTALQTYVFTHDWEMSHHNLYFQRRDIAMGVTHVILLIIPHLQIILLQVQNIEMGLPSIDLKDFKASHVTWLADDQPRPTPPSQPSQLHHNHQTRPPYKFRSNKKRCNSKTVCNNLLWCNNYQRLRSTVTSLRS